jgi:hypothetical protein
MDRTNKQVNNKGAKTMNKDLNVQNLKVWQRRGLILLGAVIGGATVYSLLRWLEQRKKAKAQVGSVPPQ